jgi:hypothetical protein
MILGPRTDPAFVYQDISVARTTAYSISGTNANFFRYPIKMRDGLRLGLRYLVIQIWHRFGDPIGLSLNIKTMNQGVVKFVFSTVERRNQSIPVRNQVKIQMERIEHDVWVNLSFDLAWIVKNFVPGDTFECLQSMEIGPSCLIRWIFASGTQLSPDQAGKDLPRAARFIGSIRCVTVLISELAGPEARPREIPRPGRSARRTSGPIPLALPPMSIDDNPFEVRGYGKRVARTVSSDSSPSREGEEELELVLMEGLNCYYCPDNQRYYQVDK